MMNVFYQPFYELKFMIMRKLLFLLSILFVFAACTKTVESEGKAWESNKQAAKELSIDYPAFKTVIEEQIAKAETVMKEAEGISNEEQKIEKMAEANKMLTSGFIGGLKSIESDLDKMESKVLELQGLQMDSIARRNADRIINTADEAKAKAKDVLNKGATTVADAELVVSKVEKDVDDVIRNLDKAISDVNAQNTETTTSESSADTSSTPAETDKANVKCDYCGKMNSHDATECKYCGGPIE